jgi:Coenzyme PQQ synthesis protein D (PqqD)
MVDQQRPLARSERVIIEALRDELLVYNLDNDEAHSLDASAAAIWRACDGALTVTEISARVGLSEAAVRSTVERLAGLDLLAAGSFTRPTHSRRAVLRRGLVAGAAVTAAAPLITSIVAPAAAGTTSGCAALNESCVNQVCCSGLVCCGSNPSVRFCVENCVD